MNSPGRGDTVVALACEHLAAGRPLTLRAEGNSMWPLLKDGDHLTVYPCSRADGLDVGDIVLITLAGRLVLHRVVEISDFGVTTKGDAVAHPDPRVRRDDVLGRLRLPYPRFQRACALLSARGGRPLAFVLRRLRLAAERSAV